MSDRKVTSRIGSTSARLGLNLAWRAYSGQDGFFRVRTLARANTALAWDGDTISGDAASRGHATRCLRGPGNPNTTNNPRPALVNLVVVTIWKCRHVLLSVECLLCYSYTQSRRQLQITNRNPGRALLFRTRRLFLAAWWRVRISAPKIFCPPRFRNRLCASGFHGSWGQDSCSGESDFSGTTSLFWTTTRNPRKSNPKNRVRERDHQCSRHTGYPNQRGPTLGDLVKWASHTYIISTESDIENRSLNRIIRELIATPCKTEKQAFLTKIPQ